MIRSMIVLALFLAPELSQAQIKSCHSGYWSIDEVVTASAVEEYGPFPADGMGMHLEQVGNGLWAGAFYLNDGWLTFTVDNEGGGDLFTTVFSESGGFEGNTLITDDSVYVIPEKGIAGFSRPNLQPQANSIWPCFFTDYCFREFTVTQITFPQGFCDEP